MEGTTQTGAKIRRMLQMGVPYRTIKSKLGVSGSTISYHAGRIGINNAPNRGGRVRYDYADVQKRIDDGETYEQIGSALGINKNTIWKAIGRGALMPRPKLSERTLADLLALVSGRRAEAHERKAIRAALVREGVCEYKCAECGIEEWRGARLSLELHHIDGDPTHNGLRNFALHCPNCHSITDNWHGRNTRAAKARNGLR